MTVKSTPTTTPDWQAAVRRRTRFYILAAVLLATLFGFLVFQFFSHQQQIAPGELTSAVFASEDIESGTLLTSAMLDVHEVSLLAVPESHLSYREQAMGKLTLYPVVKGEVVLPEKLAGDRGGAVAQRCPALLAFSFPNLPWISPVQWAKCMMAVARTTPKAAVQGVSQFGR